MVEAVRSRMMRSVRQRNTTPELRVRRALVQLGLRYRLHMRELPGTPDIVLTRLRLVLFVHGCFWHRHFECAQATVPKTNREFWMAKFAANVRRDEAKRKELQEMGWRVVEIWECETKDADALKSVLEDALANI